MESLPQNKRRKIGNEGTTTDKTEEDAEELKTPSEEHTQNVSSSESSSTPLRRSTRQRSVTQRPYDDYIHEETPKRVKKQTPKKKVQFSEVYSHHRFRKKVNRKRKPLRKRK